MRLKQVDVPSAARGNGKVAGSEFGPEEIAALLELWRPAVLRQMRRSRLWWDASADEHEDQYQDVALALFGRRFESEEHLRRALWTALGFRARDFWKSARRRETSVGEIFDDALGFDAADDVVEAAATLADRRQVEDCLAELDGRERAVYRLIHGEGLSRRRAARALGVRDADVLRALYSAQRRIDRVVLLLMSGRLCARRGPAVEALARGEAAATEVDQARAHLAHCHDCLLAFRKHRAELSRRVAATLPLPVLGSDPAVLERATDGLREVGRTLRRVAGSVADRAPSSGTEAVAGGAGSAAAAKVVAGLCITAAAGGGAVCAATLGMFGHESHRGATRVAKHHPSRTRVAKHQRRASASPIARVAPASARIAAQQAAPSRRRSSQRSAPSSTTKSAPTRSSRPAQPQQEFFDASGGSGSSASSGSSSDGVHAASKPAASRTSTAPNSSSGGGEEFFGG